MSSLDFSDYNFDDLTENDFVYLDPPYSVSCAVYQDGKRGFKGWNNECDLKLMEICDKLNAKNIKFAMSNMTHSKGRLNQELIEWSKKYKIHYLDKKYNNCNHQRVTAKDDVEVLIINY